MYKVKPKELKRCKNWICEKCTKFTNDNDSENLDDMINNIENECESLFNQYTVSDVQIWRKSLKICALIHSVI